MSQGVLVQYLCFIVIVKIFGKEVLAHLNWGYKLFYYVVYHFCLLTMSVIATPVSTLPLTWRERRKMNFQFHFKYAVLKISENFPRKNLLLLGFLSTFSILAYQFSHSTSGSPQVISHKQYRPCPKLPKDVNYSSSSIRSKTLPPSLPSEHISLIVCLFFVRMCPDSGILAIFSSMRKRNPSLFKLTHGDPSNYSELQRTF